MRPGEGRVKGPKVLAFTCEMVTIFSGYHKVEIAVCLCWETNRVEQAQGRGLYIFSLSVKEGSVSHAHTLTFRCASSVS